MSPTWLDELVSHHQELESPLSFWRWAALVSISAIVKDQIWLDRQIYNLYPNIYVMLHAESGLKKGPAIAMARKLVSKVNNTHIITGRSSIQGILKEMGSGHTQPGGKVVNKNSVFICSSELSSSIVGDKVAADILTDLYDRQWNVGQWKSLLKMESFELKDPTITMFTATNEAHSEDFFQKKDVQGGYFARTFIIHESKANRRNSLSVPLKNPPDYNKYNEYLISLAKLKGPFQSLGSQIISDIHPYEWTDPDTKETNFYSEAGLRYETWYYEFFSARSEQLIKDETGTLNRFGDSVLKVAMLMSLARAPDMIITLADMDQAIEECEKLIGNVRRTTLGSRGLSDTALLKTKIIHELLTRDTHSISQPMLMKKMWMHYGDVKEFGELMISMESSGILAIETMGNQTIYKMPDKTLNEWKHFFTGKMSKQ